MFKVLDKQCDQCLFSKDSIVSDDSRKEILESCKTRGKETYFICHKTKNTCCKGFYDSGYADKVQLVQVAKRLNLIEFVSLPPKD